MDFLCLIFVTMVLLTRPSDYISLPNLYLIVIVSCLLVSLLSGSIARVLSLVSPRSLRRWPVSACVIGLLGATVLSDVANMKIDVLLGPGFEFSKVIVFFLLLVGLVNTQRRLRRLMLATALFISVTVAISVLQYHGYVDFEAFYVPWEGGRIYGGLIEDRMIGPGSYCDPNDVCALINLAMMLSLYGLFTARPRVLRVPWLALLVLQGYALKLTQSRGGLLGAMVGLGVFFWAQFGGRRAALTLAMSLPVLLSMFGARQLNLSSQAGTAQERIQLWSDAIEHFKRSPIVGVGGECLVTYMRPPHNTFLTAYCDLGIIGGTLFLGAFFLGFLRLYQLGSRAGARPVRASRRPARPAFGPGPVPAPIPGGTVDPELEQIHPFLVGAIAGYALTVASTNQTYMVVTYEVLGFVAAYIQIAESRPSAGVGRMLFDGRTIGRLCLASVGFMALLFFYTQLKVRW